MIFVIIAYVYLFKKIINRKSYIDLFTFLILLSVPFYYGQHIIAILNPNYLIQNYDFSILDKRIPDDYIIYGTFLAIDSLLIMYSGYLSVHSNRIIRNNQVNSNYNCYLKYIGWLFLLITIIPTIDLLIAQYKLTLINGYLGRRIMENESDYFEILGVSYTKILLAQLFIPSVFSLVIYYNGKKHTKLLFGLLIGYSILYAMTGSRFTILKIIISMVFIMFIWIKQPTIKDVKRLFLFGIGTAAFFTIGSIVRNIGIDSIEGNDISSNFKIFDTLWESGITFTTISNILYRCPENVDFFYGNSYIGALLQCIPGASNFDFFSENTLHLSAVFSPFYFGKNALFGYGSSFIAELYYNFGYLMFFIVYWFGKCFAMIKNAMIKARNSNKPLTFLLCVCLCGELAYAIRNDLCNIPRNLLFSAGVICIVAKIIERLRK